MQKHNSLAHILDIYRDPQLIYWYGTQWTFSIHHNKYQTSQHFLHGNILLVGGYQFIQFSKTWDLYLDDSCRIYIRVPKQNKKHAMCLYRLIMIINQKLDGLLADNFDSNSETLVKKEINTVMKPNLAFILVSTRWKGTQLLTTTLYHPRNDDTIITAVSGIYYWFINMFPPILPCALDWNCLIMPWSPDIPPEIIFGTQQSH